MGEDIEGSRRQVIGHHQMQAHDGHHVDAVLELVVSDRNDMNIIGDP